MYLRAKNFEDESISRVYRLISRSVHALTLISLLTSLQALLHTYIPTYTYHAISTFKSIHTLYTYTYIHTYIHALYIHTYMHYTYIHALYIHTYIHTGEVEVED